MIDSDSKDFIKQNQAIIKRIIKELMQDYFNRVVDEEDPHKKEVLSLMVKEFRNAIGMIENISNLKEKKESKEEEFTGV